MSDRLTAQLAFLNEIDKLKDVVRATTLCDGSRRERTGEHSWHIAMYALVLADLAGPEVRIERVIRMLLIHDIVEIDAGDVPIHAQVDAAAQAEKEAQAAERLFGLLPEGQGDDLRTLWEEFEAAESPDALFAKALDRVQPVLQNLASGGGSWDDYNVTLEQIDSRVGAKVTPGAPALWAHVRALVAAHFEAKTQG